MEELKKQLNSIQNPIKGSKSNVTSPIKNNNTKLNSEIRNSILRGELLRFAILLPAVKLNITELKKTNPKYLELLIKIIKVSLTQLSGVDLEVPLNILLSQFKDASFYNQEALDFTWEVLNQADTLTSKYYLSTFAAGPISNTNLKKQFKATIPLIKYVLSTLNNSNDLTKSKNFINAVKILVNENANADKIKLLPKIKYKIETLTSKDYPIDVIKIIYSKTSTENIIYNIENLTKSNLTQDFDYGNYLIKNSL